jgi:putative hemolysin
MSGSAHLIALATLMVVLAGMFAGAETGIYRLSRLRLRLGIERRQWSFVLLGKVMGDSSALLLSLLVGTNLSHYVATSLVTGIFLGLVASERIAEILATALTAPLLFVFSELIPKNIFLYRAERLTSLLAPLLYVSHKLFTWCGAVPLLRLTSQAFSRLIGSAVSSKTVITSTKSQQVRAILKDTHDEGLLSPVQSDIIDRIINVPGLRLNAVLVPLTRAQSVDVRSDRAALLNRLKRHAFSRLLVWDGTPAHIVGFINVYDVLSVEEDFESLDTFVTPIHRLDAGTPVIDAMDTMRRERLKIVLVTRSRRGAHDAPVGIVTMKDLVEELLGELAEW